MENRILSLLDPNDIMWEDKVDQTLELLGFPENIDLFPPYFLKSTFPKLGGRILLYELNNKITAVGFLFPNGYIAPQTKTYILRLHKVEGSSSLRIIESLNDLQEKIGRIELYDPCKEKKFRETHHLIGNLDIGRPNKEEAKIIQELQRTIWKSELGYVYPCDIHSVEFSACSSLVARLNKEIVGFLFGFCSFSLPKGLERWQVIDTNKVMIESQVLGVLPDYRGQGIAYLLKCEQRVLALSSNIEVIHWTVDPLQLPNAFLNYSKLGAISIEFFANYYSFRNELNRVPASRLGISWLINTERTNSLLSHNIRYNNYEEQETIKVELDTNSSFQDFDKENRIILFEIPENWNKVQNDDINLAIQIREKTDNYLHTFLNNKFYAIIDVIQRGEKYYLVLSKNLPKSFYF